MYVLRNTVPVCDLTIRLPNGQEGYVTDGELPFAGELQPAEPDVGIWRPYVEDYWMDGKGWVEVALGEDILRLELDPGHPTAKQLLATLDADEIEEKLLENA